MSNMNNSSQSLDFMPFDLVPFDFDAFRAWLEARSSHVIGFSGDEYQCPLARFLSGCGHEYGVDDSGYWIVGYPETFSLPPWASAFMRCLDFTHPLVEVTGAQALGLLDAVCASLLPVQKIFTLGYAAKGADAQLSTLMSDPAMVSVDIRLSPRSRFRPAFRKSALERRFEMRYWHVPELGNVNYRDRSLPIELVNEAFGLHQLQTLLKQGYSVCLLCACAHVEQCHRRVVADLLVERCLCEIVHL